MTKYYKIKYHTEDGVTIVDELTEVFDVIVEEDAGTAHLSNDEVIQYIVAQDRVEVDDDGELVIKLNDEILDELYEAFEIGELQICWL